MRRELKILASFDIFLALLVVTLSVFGVLIVQAVAQLQPVYAGLPAQQRFHVITGVIVMLTVSLIDYRLISRFYHVIYALCILLLIIVLIIGPDAITGTARWIFFTLPVLGSVSVQPSEFAKLFLIISLSAYINNCENINRPLCLLSYIFLSLLPVLLVMYQPSLSAAMVLLAIGLTILFVGGLYYRTIIITSILSLPFIILFYFDMLREQPLFITRVLSDRQWQRIQTHLNPESVNPDAVLQMDRSLFAIGSGGLYGQGFMNNRTFVIHGHNDFVFSVAAEQFGFMGSMVLLTIIGIIIVKCFLAAYSSVDRLGQLITGGVAGMLLFETFVNVGVATGLLPNTGMPFPFLSYGGTHMWTHMAAIGLVLNIKLSRAREDIESESEDL